MPLSEREKAILADLERSFEHEERLGKRLQLALAKQRRFTLLATAITTYLLGTALLILTFTHFLLVALVGLGIMFASLLGFVRVLATRKRETSSPQ